MTHDERMTGAENYALKKIGDGMHPAVALAAASMTYGIGPASIAVLRGRIEAND
jgi:hypothetical protein